MNNALNFPLNRSSSISGSRIFNGYLIGVTNAADNDEIWLAPYPK
jgi:hypothetical protein